MEESWRNLGAGCAAVHPSLGSRPAFGRPAAGLRPASGRPPAGFYALRQRFAARKRGGALGMVSGTVFFVISRFRVEVSPKTSTRKT